MKKNKIIITTITIVTISSIFILFNFRKLYYFYSLIDFGQNLKKRELVIKLIKNHKLSRYTFRSSQNWINLPDSLKFLSQDGNVRVEKINNKLSVFFYIKYRNSEAPIGFGYFDGGISRSKLYSIKDPNSFFFRNMWVKRIKPDWFYVDYIMNTEPGP